MNVGADTLKQSGNQLVASAKNDRRQLGRTQLEQDRDCIGGQYVLEHLTDFIGPPVAGERVQGGAHRIHLDLIDSHGESPVTPALAGTQKPPRRAGVRLSREAVACVRLRVPRPGCASPCGVERAETTTRGF